MATGGMLGLKNGRARRCRTVVYGRRYHNLDGTGGFAILESTNPAALADYALDWNGLIKIEITPIMDDETISTVLPKHFN